MVQVLNKDGRRYEYGIPAYNLESREVSYSVKKASNPDFQTNLVTSNALEERDPISNKLIGYTPEDESDKATDQYFNRQVTPAYSHSFLLTSVYTPDYVDVTGDGITEDDLGDAVKFNYSRVFSSSNPYRWRSPMNPVIKNQECRRFPIFGCVPIYKSQMNGNYEEGLKTDYRDDKASYIYGSKEVWYANSIETKTMIATFKISTRADAYNQVNELGGNNGQYLYKLDEINLYSKAEVASIGFAAAKPIKTVHFEYAYDLCKNFPLNPFSSITALYNLSGKLTLKKIWFTYNNNTKGQKNPYIFSYRNNKDYAYQVSDNWGNYKDPVDNPGAVSNKDYPYPVNNINNAGKASNVAPWALEQIQLPSGSKINVTYEADDYAYVQNKRAASLFQIIAMGKSSDYSKSNNSMYEGAGDANDHRFLFVKLPYAVADMKEVKRYLEGLEYIYCRVLVKMPDDPAFDIRHNGYEYVKVYVKPVEGSYGYVNNDKSIIWFQIKGTRKKSSKDGEYQPIAKAALQFLRNELPAKAFPGSQFPADQPLDVKTFATALISAFGDVKNMALGFHTAKKTIGVCKYFDPQKSFVRLNSPLFGKVGGGYRVKKVVISDNWNAMTGRKDATYGQEYHYTTIKKIDGINRSISSGVASYEPIVGGEENPFRLPIENFDEQTSPLGPISSIYTEGPLLESFYPSASVGYSRVLVKSIHNRDIKSATGWDETNFYTAYDYPVQADYTPLTDGFKKYTSPLRAILKINTLKSRSFSQGFRVELNDMHGKMRSQKSFAQGDSINPITYTEYFYKSQAINSESKKLVNTALTIDRWGNVNSSKIGEDIEVMSDFREQRSFMFSGGFNANFHFFTIGPFPVFIPAFLKLPQSDETLYRAAAITKIINRHALLDSVVSVDKGSRVSTRDLAYDSETGDVLVTKTNNEFDDPVYNVSVPAHWAYDRMGGAYQNVGVTVGNAALSKGSLINASYEQFFVPGDEVLATATDGNNTQGTILWVTKTELYSNNPGYINPALQYQGPTYTGLKFVDRVGKVVLDTILNLKIIRSGRRNTGSMGAGSVTLLSNPIVGGKLALFDTAATGNLKVINASVAVFKEDWKVKENYWRFDSCFRNIVQNSVSISPTKTLLVKQLFRKDYTRNWRGKCNENITSPSEMSSFNSSNFVASYQRQNVGVCNPLIGSDKYKYYQRIVRSLIDFDLSSLPNNATINSASLTLTGKIPSTVWPEWSTKTNAHVARPSAPQAVSNAANLFRITKPWGSTTSFSNTLANFYDHSLGSIGNLGIVPPGSPLPVDVRAFVQNKLQYPASNYGLILVENKEFQLNSPTTDEENTLSFCAGNTSNSYNSYTSRNPLGHFMTLKTDTSTNSDEVSNISVPSPNCSGPTLTINFSTISTGCTTECRSQLYQRAINPYVQGILGNYRPYGTYTYFTDRRENITSSTDIRKDGTIKKFEPFWLIESNANKIPNIWMRHDENKGSDWVLSSENTLFDKKGFNIENKDPLDRYTAGQYGYNNTLPVAVTQNSKYREAAFEGFEDYTFKTVSCQAGLCDTVLQRHFDWSQYKSRIVSDASHTGKYAMRLSNVDSVQISTSITNITSDQNFIWLGLQNDTAVRTGIGTKLPLFQPTHGSDFVVSAWVKETTLCPNGIYLNSQIDISFKRNNNVRSTVISLRPTGLIIEGWQRVEAVVSIPAEASQYTSMILKLKSNLAGNTIYFDDIRIHPYHANMKSFVYDPVTLRLMAELDENNYASLYEYDDEGTLIRTKKETERGIKTINETRSALQKLNQ